MLKKLLTLFACIIFFSGTSQVITPVFDSILMGDGQYLHCDVYKPAACTQCPTILIHTPYGKIFYQYTGLPLGIGANINASNYAVVIVDWRGRFTNTAAAYAGNPSRGEDGYDIIEWIAAQSWSDGKVGTWGPSALGKCQFDASVKMPPHLTCICPLVAAPQFNYQDYFYGGALKTEFVEQLDGLGYGISPLIMPHPTKDIVWTYSEFLSYQPDSIFVPALMIGGWYDHNIENMLTFFNGIRTQSPLAVRNEHRLLMGPWAHGGNGSAVVGSANQGQLSYSNAAGWSDSLALAFFDYHMRGISNGWNATPYVQYYQMGENNWQTSASWPPAGLNNTNYFMHDDLSLSTSAPVTASSALTFVYDPNDPSPTVGGATLRLDLEQGPYRQDTAVENRNDILVFSTPLLTQDVVMKGKAVVHLKVSSDRKDTDFAIRLCDVYPDGRSMLLQSGIRRMRFRNGYTASDTASMVPGTIYDCVIDLPATCNTFMAGHKIRVDVSSSNYPMYNRNMNNGNAMYPGNDMDSLLNPLVASNTVYLNASNNSYITLPLAPSTSAVHEVKNEVYFDVFPNPASDELVVLFEKSINGELLLSDAQGRLLIRKNINAPAINLDVSSFVSGIYFLSVNTDSGNSVKKIVVGRK